MRRSKLVKRFPVPPSVADYSAWKECLADEAAHQCIYCDLHDAVFGGMRNYHVEHFRPKKHFPDLRQHYPNLYYACCVCNAYKGEDWLEGDTAETAGYLDPCVIDYGVVFAVDQSGLVTSDVVAGRYMIARLHLNRPHMLQERRLERFHRRWRGAMVALESVFSGGAGKVGEASVASTLLRVHSGISAILSELRALTPYSRDQLR